jgi:GATA-binding protein
MGVMPPVGMVVMPAGGVPSVAELERHYHELHEHRRRLEEVLERTDRMMLGVKRGLEEMRGAQPAGGAGHEGAGSASAPQQQQDSQQQQQPTASSPTAPAVPLPTRTSPGAKERRDGPSIWPVVVHDA